MSLQRSLVRVRRWNRGCVGLRDLMEEIKLSKELKRAWPLENENESRKKKVNRVSPSSYASILIEHISVHIQNVYNTGQS